MLERCLIKKHKQFPGYGGRGILVCQEWQDDFVSFRDWALANGYREDLEIDRIDVNGNYEPANCRWVTNTQQARNTRKTVRIRAFGEEKSLKEWSEDPRCVVMYVCLYERIRKGCDPEFAMTHPKQTNTKRMPRATDGGAGKPLTAAEFREFVNH